MTDQSSECTLQSKHDYKHLSAIRNVKVKHYHAANGHFTERSFTNDCKSITQRITFCGVGAHHQNGIAEITIKQLTLISWNLLVHAQNY